jgi:hypothetical protein|tara:strand:+ start:10322 stop:10549 length:228 start_codon:yes stop_codon:yes gene_type:complete
MRQEVLKNFDLDPDHVRIIVNWGKMVVNASVFVPCVNTQKATQQAKTIAKEKSWEFKIHVRIEDNKLGIRIWRLL